MKNIAIEVDSKGFLSQELNRVLKRASTFDEALRNALLDLLALGRR